MLPVPLPHPAHGRVQRRFRHLEVLRPVRHPAVVLAPRHLIRVAGQVAAGELVMGADLRAAKAAKERLRLVRASLGRAVSLAVVDPLRQEAGMQHVP